MISVSVGEAKNKLPYFLHLVEENNESIQITRHGKTVAVINNKESSTVIDKTTLFTNGLNKWRAKYSSNLNLLSNNEIDTVFNREKDEEPFVRHNEDFQ